MVVVAAGCYTFGNHRTKAVSPRGLAEAYFFSPLKKKRPPGLLSSHVPEQIKTLTSFWGHHGWLGMQPTGLLMRCLRLPFGYVDSPRCFCAMTEAVAAIPSLALVMTNIHPGGMASTRGGLISVWPCASEGSESTLREADVLATLPMYDPGMLASWYRRR